MAQLKEEPTAPASMPAAHTVTTNTSTGAKTLQLETPILLGGVETHSLTLRRPYARDFRATFTKANVEACSMQQLLLVMGANLAGVSDDEIDQLTLADTIKFLEIVDSFQQAAPTASSAS